MKTQVDVARACGINPISLNAILNGRRNPSAKLANRLQDATGVAREVWIFGTPEERRAAWKEAKEAKQ